MRLHWPRNADLPAYARLAFGTHHRCPLMTSGPRGERQDETNKHEDPTCDPKRRTRWLEASVCPPELSRIPKDIPKANTGSPEEKHTKPGHDDAGQNYYSHRLAHLTSIADPLILSSGGAKEAIEAGRWRLRHGKAREPFE